MAAEPDRRRRSTRPLAVGIAVLAVVGVVLVFVLADNEQVLVVGPPGPAVLEGIDERETVAVTGVVRQIPDDASQALTNAAALEEFEGRLGIFATDVRPADDEEAAVADRVDLEDIAGGDELLIGRRVTVVASVDNDLGGRFFTLEDD